MSVRMQVATIPVLLLAGFALHCPRIVELQVPDRAIATVVFAVANATEPIEPQEPVATAAADNAYADATLRQFAAEPALIDLIEDQGSDPDAEVREEASAVLALTSDPTPP